MQIAKTALVYFLHLVALFAGLAAINEGIRLWRKEHDEFVGLCVAISGLLALSFALGLI